MRAAIGLLRREPKARHFFAAHAQSSVGTGAGYVALLVLAYDRTESAWVVTIVLLADFLPSMVLGPLFGTAADRWSRKGCAIAADAIRAIAFVGIGLVDGTTAMIALALLAGAGTGIFTPAAMAWLPQLVSKERLPAGTALFGALADAGYTLGPALAALGFLLAGPETVVVANGLTFALSASLLFRLSSAPACVEDKDEAGAERGSFLQELREGLRCTRRLPGIPAVIFASAAGVLFAGALNLGEFLLAKETLHAGDSGFALMVAVYGLGLALGALGGSGGGSASGLKARFLAGLLLQGVAIAASGAAPVVAVALITFAVTGFGDGFMLVHERLLIQSTVPDRLLGRVFGFRGALASWAFAGAFLGASAVASTLGPRPVFFVAGLMCIVTWAFAALALRRVWLPADELVRRDPVPLPEPSLVSP